MLPLLDYIGCFSIISISRGRDQKQIIQDLVKLQFQQQRIMSDKLNFGNRARYVQFRFEDSLRKYEPPPRKKVKLNESAHENGEKKNYESARDYRLTRLCETRRIYHATSREKASEFSKKKQAMNESAKKASNHVSDFNCSENICHQAEQHKSSAHYFQYQDTIVNSNLAINSNPTLAPSLKWEIQIRQTPIKQSVINELNRQSMLDDSQKSQQQQIGQANIEDDGKIKDIDFHIGLVEELHQKIFNQYLRLQPEIDSQQLKQNQQSNQAILQNINTQNCSVIHQQQVQVCSKLAQDCDQNQELLNQHINDENQLQQNYNDNVPLIKFNKIQSQTCQKQQNQQKEQTKMEAEPTGRIKIKGGKAECYLSARVIYKLCSSNLSPNRITRSIVRHHPYLEDVSQLFQIVAQNFNGRKQYSFNS